MSEMSDWRGRARPERAPLAGRWVTLEPLDPARHAQPLWRAHEGTDTAATFHYLPYGPFADEEAFAAHLARQAADPSDIFYALVSDRGPAGVASLMRIDAQNGVAEVGHICLSPALQRSRAATEMVFLMGTLLFDTLGYRRFEWKCDDANAASKGAAERFGFRPEGVFRKHRVVKGRNRDTAWFAMLDDDWPARRAAFTHWLAPENFDEAGRQRAHLQRAKS